MLFTSRTPDHLTASATAQLGMNLYYQCGLSSIFSYKVHLVHADSTGSLVDRLPLEGHTYKVKGNSAKVHVYDFTPSETKDLQDDMSGITLYRWSFGGLSDEGWSVPMGTLLLHPHRIHTCRHTSKYIRPLFRVSRTE